MLHYCKFIPGIVLYASEDDETCTNGWYEHGKYPFVFDVMFPEKGSPAGFGYLDVMVNPQEYIDKLDSVILKSANLSKPRYFVSSGSNVNAEDFADLSKDLVEVSGTMDETKIKQIQPPQLPEYVINMRTLKVDELKETSGNRDFSQGSTASGVTAASAIAALQEAGSKLSRDMIKTSYTAHAEVVTLIIELIRQFYDLPRCYRITQSNGDAQYVMMDKSELQEQTATMMDGEILTRRPVFDVKISAQKASPYSRIANNELAKELFGMGLFNPQLADQALAVVSMMDFDRREEVIKKISENGTMYQEIQQLQQILAQLAPMVAEMTNRPDLIQAVNGLIGNNQMAMTDVNVNQGNSIKTNSLGQAVNTDTSQAGKARGKGSYSNGGKPVTEITFENVPGYFRLKVEGHAGYGCAMGLPEGHDIVCAAVSAIGQTAAQCMIDLGEEKAVVIQDLQIKRGIDRHSCIGQEESTEAFERDGLYHTERV